MSQFWTRTRLSGPKGRKNRFPHEFCGKICYGLWPLIGFWSDTFQSSSYPLIQKRIAQITPWECFFLFLLNSISRKERLVKELRVKFVFFTEIIILKQFFVSNNFQSSSSYFPPDALLLQSRVSPNHCPTALLIMPGWYQKSEMGTKMENLMQKRVQRDRGKNGPQNACSREFSIFSPFSCHFCNGKPNWKEGSAGQGQKRWIFEGVFHFFSIFIFSPMAGFWPSFHAMPARHDPKTNCIVDCCDAIPLAYIITHTKETASTEDLLYPSRTFTGPNFIHPHPPHPWKYPSRGGGCIKGGGGVKNSCRVGPQNIHPHPPSPGKWLLARSGGEGGGAYIIFLRGTLPMSLGMLNSGIKVIVVEINLKKIRGGRYCGEFWHLLLEH